MTKQQLINKGYQFNNISIQGKLKWTDGRDGEAIVTDSEGNEYYIESSSSPLFDFKNNRNQLVTFELANVPGYGIIGWNAKQL